MGGGHQRAVQEQRRSLVGDGGRGRLGGVGQGGLVTGRRGQGEGSDLAEAWEWELWLDEGGQGRLAGRGPGRRAVEGGSTAPSY